MNRWNVIQKELKKAGLKQRFTANRLRHTYATIAANSSEIAPKVLEGMLGHANFKTTMNTYVGLDTDEMIASSQNLSGEYEKSWAKVAEKVAALKRKKRLQHRRSDAPESMKIASEVAGSVRFEYSENGKTLRRRCSGGHSYNSCTNNNRFAADILCN